MPYVEDCSHSVNQEFHSSRTSDLCCNEITFALQVLQSYFFFFFLLELLMFTLEQGICKYNMQRQLSTMANTFHCIINPILVHTKKCLSRLTLLSQCASQTFSLHVSYTSLYTTIFSASILIQYNFLLQFSDTIHYLLLQPKFLTKTFMTCACSFSRTIILTNCSTFLFSRITKEIDGKKIKKKKKATSNKVQIGRVKGYHCFVQKCRWTDNACYEKLEIMRLVNGRIG